MCALLAVAWSPLVNALGSDRLRVALATVDPETTDPWGATTALRREGLREVYYSAGPNGVDECGRGDDLEVSSDERAKARHLHKGPMLLWSVAVFLIWLVHGPGVWAARDSPLLEAWRVVLIWIHLWLFCGLFLTGILGGPQGWLKLRLVEGFRAWEARVPHVMSVETSMLLSLGALSLAAAAVWRWRRPRERGPAASSGRFGSIE